MNARDLLLSPRLSDSEVEEFLSRFGLERPLEADRRLQEMARLVGHPARLADLAPSLLEEVRQAADPDAAMTRLTSLMEAVASPRNLLSQLLEDRLMLARLLAILGASGYLTRLLIRSPDDLYWLLTDATLSDSPDGPALLGQAVDAVRPFEGFESALEALRRFRRRQSLRIGALDILGKASVDQVVAQLSQVADAVLETAFRIAARQSPQRPQMAILALGKLGGRELNFSSDVDLVYAFGDDQDPREMQRFARSLTRALSDHGEEGRLYRVDLRLRPQGSSGQVAYSMEAFRHYFSNWADTADRLAFLKCRPVAGTESLGLQFLELSRRFVFRSYRDLAAVEEIRWLKRRSDQRLETGSPRPEGENVKLGQGGIREIEFFAQAFQMLHGSEHPELRTTSTLKALDRLLDGGLLELHDHRRLQQAYRFLRRLEHKLQLKEDLQTHSLPRDAHELRVLARLMQSSPQGDSESFSSELQRRLGQVREIFEGLFEEQRLPSGWEELLINPTLRGPEGIEWLTRRGVESPQDIHAGLMELLDAPAFPQSPTRIRNVLANLSPSLIEAASRMERPRYLFTRLDRVARAQPSRAAFWNRLLQSPSLAKRLFLAVSTGESFAEALIANPNFLQLLASPSLGELAPTPDDRRSMRLHKQRREFEIGICELFSDLGVMQARRELSDLAQSCLQVASEAVWKELGMRPSSAVIIALGKLGGRELTYHSDIDLVFLYDDTQDPEMADVCNQFVHKLIEYLAGYFDAPAGYHLDFRLRPEGRRSAWATPASAFRRYFKGRAEAWEYVAYRKARVVWSTGDSLNDILQQALSGGRQAVDAQALAHLKHRMEKELSQEGHGRFFDFKTGPGGMTDVQLVVQYLQLIHGLTGGRLTCEVIDELETADRLAADEAGILREGWLFWLRLESCVRLSAGRSSTRLSRDPIACRLPARLMGLGDADQLLAQVRLHRNAVRSVRRRHLDDS